MIVKEFMFLPHFGSHPTPMKAPRHDFLWHDVQSKLALAFPFIYYYFSMYRMMMYYNQSLSIG